MRQWQRNTAILMVFVMAVALLAGCAPDPSQYKPIDRENAGIWDRFLVLPLSDMLDKFNDWLGSYGLSILVVTLLVRIIVFPLTWKQQQSSKAMQELQPQLVKIREKYSKNQQKMQEETMKLFQKHGVNPMAGCLPMLVQIPILVAFYQAIMTNPSISKASFLYLQLGKPDPYWILPILAAFTTFLQLVATGAGDNPQMKIMLWFMPAMVFVLAYQFPAALSLYWVYGNVITIIQYLLFFRTKKKSKATA